MRGVWRGRESPGIGGALSNAARPLIPYVVVRREKDEDLSVDSEEELGTLDRIACGQSNDAQPSGFGLGVQRVNMVLE